MSFIHCDICLRKENNPPLYGKIISKYGFDVHEFCLYSSDIPQRGCSTTNSLNGFLKSDIRNSLPTFREKECYLCGRKSAPVNCKHPKCNRSWHYSCGRENNCITQFVGQFKSYCSRHVPDTNVCKHNAPVFCYVCFQLIQDYHPANSILSSCCLKYAEKNPDFGLTVEDMKMQGFTHSLCIQRYVANAGYDSKCIHCPMKEIMSNKEWQNQMRLKGIFVPMKMAEWETDGRFMDQTKKKCQDANCPNPSNTSNVWTCHVCGCFPSHLKCAKVSSVDEYCCVKCIDQSFVERVPKFK